MLKAKLLFVLQLFLLSFFYGHESQGKLFSNAYISFEIPDQWKCEADATDWVCRSVDPVSSREAIIILVAKEVGPNDNIAAYQTHLKTPKTVMSRAGIPGSSQVLHVKQVYINNQIWVDGWHLSSEIPDYYTRYLATAKEQIAILVTFTAHKSQYTKYSQQFFAAINSLKILSSKFIANRHDVGPLSPGAETLGTALDGGGLTALPPTEMKKKKAKSSNNSNILFGVGLLLAAIGAWLFYKNKKR